MSGSEGAGGAGPSARAEPCRLLPKSAPLALFHGLRPRSREFCVKKKQNPGFAMVGSVTSKSGVMSEALSAGLFGNDPRRAAVGPGRARGGRGGGPIGYYVLMMSTIPFSLI